MAVIRLLVTCEEHPFVIVISDTLQIFLPILCCSWSLCSVYLSLPFGVL